MRFSDHTEKEINKSSEIKYVFKNNTIIKNKKIQIPCHFPAQ